MSSVWFSWFLGFLAFDGSFVYPTYRKKGNESCISFCIHYNDRFVLHKIKSILNTQAKVRNYPEYESPQSQLVIYDRDDIMLRYRNIKTEIPDDIIPRHYIRGLIDGDGCLNYRKKRQTFRINLVNGNFLFPDYVSKVVSSLFMTPYKVPRFKSSDNTFKIEWEGKIARLVAWWLYQGDIKDCVLDRKLKLYQQYVLHDKPTDSNADELFIALSHNGQYFLNRKNKGIVIHMHTTHQDSLLWAKRIRKIIPCSVPIPITKGKTKYYVSYIPIINTQSIQMDEGIVQ